jgi:hypothetical protein
MSARTDALSLALDQITDDRNALLVAHSVPAGSGTIPEHDTDGREALQRYDVVIEALLEELRQPEIAVVEVGPRDTVVLHCATMLKAEQREMLRAFADKGLPPHASTIVLDYGITLSVVRPPALQEATHHG